MVDHYEVMTLALIDLVEQDLPPEEMAVEVAALKNEYIDIFVELGYVREEYNPDQLTAWNNEAANRLFSLDLGHQEMMNAYLDELNGAGENELANEVNSMNILTQYAQFELLWQQEPEEAERLALPSPAHPR